MSKSKDACFWCDLTGSCTPSKDKLLLKPGARPCMSFPGSPWPSDPQNNRVRGRREHGQWWGQTGLRENGVYFSYFSKDTKLWQYLIGKESILEGWKRLCKGTEVSRDGGQVENGKEKPERCGTPMQLLQQDWARCGLLTSPSHLRL